MHLSEFQAWFEGFTEEMKGPPNKDQWAKIKKRVKEITADYTPAPIFIDRYVRPWRRYWDEPYLARLTTTCGSDGANAGHAALTDWSAAGKAEYKGTA